MDEVDISNDRLQHDTDRRVAEVRKKAELDPGTPGECELCGEDSPRLINGACARCRDKYKLP